MDDLLYHGMNGSNVDGAFRTLGSSFVVFAESPVASQPCEGALHHLTPGQYGEALLTGLTFYDVQHDARGLLQPVHQTTALVDTIGSELIQCVRCLHQPQ